MLLSLSSRPGRRLKDIYFGAFHCAGGSILRCIPLLWYKQFSYPLDDTWYPLYSFSSTGLHIWYNLVTVYTHKSTSSSLVYLKEGIDSLVIISSGSRSAWLHRSSFRLAKSQRPASLTL